MDNFAQNNRARGTPLGFPRLRRPPLPIIEAPRGGNNGPQPVQPWSRLRVNHRQAFNRFDKQSAGRDGADGSRLELAASRDQAPQLSNRTGIGRLTVPGKVKELFCLESARSNRHPVAARVLATGARLKHFMPVRYRPGRENYLKHFT